MSVECEALIEVLDRYTQKLELICDRICRIRRVSTVVSLGLVAVAAGSIAYPVASILLLVAVFFVERGVQQELGIFYKWGSTFHAKLEEAVRCGSQMHEHLEIDEWKKRRLDAHLTNAEYQGSQHGSSAVGKQLRKKILKTAISGNALTLSIECCQLIGSTSRDIRAIPETIAPIELPNKIL